VFTNQAHYPLQLVAPKSDEGGTRLAWWSDSALERRNEQMLNSKVPEKTQRMHSDVLTAPCSRLTSAFSLLFTIRVRPWLKKFSRGLRFSRLRHLIRLDFYHPPVN
jgi:hypothetical protein